MRGIELVNDEKRWEWRSHAGAANRSPVWQRL